MDRFLVVGATGFIGQHFVRRVDRDCDVLGTTTGSPPANHISFDLATDSIAQELPAGWKKKGGDKWAILAAGLPSLEQCRRDAGHARAVMVDGPQRCVDELADLGFRTVFLSTSYVFDDEPRGYGEDDPTRPLNTYGVLKREMEQYLEQSHPNALIARLGKVVSASAHEQHLLSEFLSNASNGKPIACIAGQILQPTLATDVVEALLEACRRRLRGCYHVANPELIRRDELAKQLLETCGTGSDIRLITADELGLSEPRPARSWLRTDKIESELGFSFTSIAGILEQFCAGH